MLGHWTLHTTSATHALKGIHQAGSTEITKTALLTVVAHAIPITRRDGKWKCIAVSEPLADVVVAAWVDRAALDVAEEVIECLDGALACVHALYICRVAIWVLHGAVASVLPLLTKSVAITVAAEVRLIGGIWIRQTLVWCIVRGCYRKGQRMFSWPAQSVQS